MPSPASFQRALVVATPISGQGKGSSLGRELAEGLGRRGVPTELLLTTAAGHATEACADLADDIDLVVSVGGDGTLREVLTGLGKRSDRGAAVRVGVLPMGTGNALGTDLGLPRDVDRSIDVILRGHSVLMDVADVNGQLSFLVTGVGPDAAVVQDVAQRRVHGRLSKWSYVPAAVRTYFTYKPIPLSVELDGKALSGTFSQVLVSNTSHYGGVAKIAPDRVLDDGLFEVFLFRRGDKLSLLLYTLRVLLGLVPGGSIQRERARLVRVTSEQPAPCEIDGDPAGTTPIEVRVTGVRYRLLVP
jgi:diacylglycerol kinase (ATP)